MLHMKSDVPTDAVTQLDEDIERAVRGKLLQLDPTVGFVGEEHGGDRHAERFWLMDPIDGTEHFIRGLPFATTMLAFIERGEVTLSFIYDFVNDHLYVAERGKGAFRNEEALRVSERPLARAYYSIETNLKKLDNRAIFDELLGRGGRVQLLCCGWEFIQIACGKLDARICFDPFGKDYDFAPGSLLVTEAGGVVRNIGSDSYDYRNYNFIAANPVMYRDLTEGEKAIFPIR